MQPGSWKADGTLVFYRQPSGSDIVEDRDLAVFNLKAQPQVRMFLETRFRERAAQFSPDGRWIAYVSDVSGRDEVYLRPYPGPGAQVPVSAGGGIEPVWSRSGNEIFYRASNKMMSVPVKTGHALALGEARALFEGSFVPDLSTTGAVPNYDVAADGRFLMVAPGTGSESIVKLSVITNFFEELTQRAPVR